jgi:hypothetical protein
MKQVARIVVVLIGFVVGGAKIAEAAPANPRSADGSPVSNRITNYCDPVCELRAQDSAFSLLIEAYRQFQSREIQIDYERRLRSAAELGNQPDSLVIGTTLKSTRTLRAWVEVLAEKERDLRLEQLQTRVVNFATAYQCARKGDESVLEEPVANKVDAGAASRELKTLRVLALGSPASADFQTIVSRPAASLFLDSAPEEPWQDEVVGPCEDTATSAAAAEPAR